MGNYKLILLKIFVPKKCAKSNEIVTNYFFLAVKDMGCMK